MLAFRVVTTAKTVRANFYTPIIEGSSSREAFMAHQPNEEFNFIGSHKIPNTVEGVIFTGSSIFNLRDGVVSTFAREKVITIKSPEGHVKGSP